jgi:hypothetical protein
MRPPLLAPEEYEELAYVRTLVAEEVFVMESYFKRKYADGYPFIADAEDLRCLDAVEMEMRKRLTEGRGRYSWDDEAIGGLAATVRMHLMMRFKRVERTIEKLPDWNLLVEGIIETEKEPVLNNVIILPKRPHLRLVKTGVSANE